MRKVKTHSFNGRKYHVFVEEPLDGICDTYVPNESPAIIVAADINTKAGLIALLHECLHLENFLASEERVEIASTDIGKLLWRLGYRRTKR